ncbi:hypothetical protein [Gloeobacter kilaueensis]|uniref:Secreted protein n=1 Tax=Gloeobacter kilaueensis (strain ATCC BAA-2537 / CCAP 1431/1 / ULC 316 / JS1) TaxID=1183438 RepID=U5QJD7_GLOK1|nr:hypothetical protein [Gloeobacter kilaueensis]AGY57785.1 hypothetical protein GKIL_1539 [Gloeobacter kilaueensis JS1]
MNRLIVSALLGVALIAPAVPAAADSVATASGLSRPAQLWERSSTYVRDKSVRTQIPGKTISEVIDLQNQVKPRLYSVNAASPSATQQATTPATGKSLSYGVAEPTDAAAASSVTTSAPSEQEKVAAGSGIVFSAGQPKVCIDNPRFNPDNDESGPRASEPYTDSTPYAGTPTAALSAACR